MSFGRTSDLIDDGTCRLVIAAPVANVVSLRSIRVAVFASSNDCKSVVVNSPVTIRVQMFVFDLANSVSASVIS